MARPYWYFGTTRSYVVAFATILNGLSFKDGWGNLREVPVHYSPRQKWLEDIQQNTDLDQMNMDVTLPRIGFEFLSMTYDPTRTTNALNKIDNVTATDPVTQKTFILNRQAYNFNVKVYVAAVRFNDLLQILEQIIPFFTPSLTVTLNDTNGLGFTTNIPINLNSIDYNIDYEGSFDNRRVISATLDFTLKGYQYSNPRVIERIKDVVINLVDADYSSTFEQIEISAAGPWVNPTVVESTTEQSNALGAISALPIPPPSNLTITNTSGSDVFYAVAGTNLDYPRVVAVNNGIAYYPDLTKISDVANIVGVTTYAAAQGASVAITDSQTIKQANWNWGPGSVFCDLTDGNLTQTAPTTGAVVEIGRVIDANTIHVDIQPAIIR